VIQGGFGAVPTADGRTRFRLWAPDLVQAGLLIEGREELPMQALGEGWHGVVADCGAGARYRFRAGDRSVPDPASRWQPEGVHGPSAVVDPTAFAWSSDDWRGRPWHEAVIYELHAGLMGGFAGVEAALPELSALGVTAIELMPVAAFSGNRNWGYDGVCAWAPQAGYGGPDGLRRLVDTAHGLGVSVLLDVVYNHFGPEGNYLAAYAGGFYRHDRATPWGDAIDFRVPAVRRFFIENALHWLVEYRIDGLRLDAVHAIADSGFLLELAAELRAKLPGRQVHLVLENEANDAALLGEGAFDAQWADELHHCVHVMLTGERDSYYADYAREPARLLARALAEGFAFQGEVSAHTGRPRGTPSAHLPPSRFVVCLQNHDQIGNRAFGERLTQLAPARAVRAATVLLLLCPQVPLLFMGQEWGSRAPFLFFTDYGGALAEAVRSGRRREFGRFAAFADPARRARIPDPNAAGTFTASRPEADDRHGTAQREWWEFHRRLLEIRRTRLAPHLAAAASLGAMAFGPRAVLARWRLGNGAELSIAANLGEGPCPCPPLPGEMLFACGEAVNATIGPFETVATLREARP
jgi:malto-oligosyltrehalose trehalohydrolase